MGFFNNDLVVATKIKENNPAYDILYRQENRAEFLRTVLEDLVRTKTGVDHYLDYTKEEREEKFFGVEKVPKKEKYKEQLMNFSTQEERKRFELEVLFSQIYDKYATIFVEPNETWIREPFLLMMAVKSEQSESEIVNPEYDCIYELNLVGQGKRKLRKQEESVNTVFLNLLKDFNLVAEPGSYSKEDVVDKLLDFMKSYYTSNTQEDIHMSFLEYMKKEQIGCFGKGK